MAFFVHIHSFGDNHLIYLIVLTVYPPVSRNKKSVYETVSYVNNCVDIVLVQLLLQPDESNTSDLYYIMIYFLLLYLACNCLIKIRDMHFLITYTIIMALDSSWSTCQQCQNFATKIGKASYLKRKKYIKSKS